MSTPLRHNSMSVTSGNVRVSLELDAVTWRNMLSNSGAMASRILAASGLSSSPDEEGHDVDALLTSRSAIIAEISRGSNYSMYPGRPKISRRCY